MSDPVGNAPGNEGPDYWVQGEILLKLGRAGSEPDKLVRVRRPFALVGRAPASDVVVADPEVSAYHVYLHLDSRGLFALDLVTRTGTRVRGTDRPSGWLRPGDKIEVAGRPVELIYARINGVDINPPRCDDDPLAESDHDQFVGVSLEPERSYEPPWVLGSELVFLGCSTSCGIQVVDPNVARTHCALMRSPQGVFLINLPGRQSSVDDVPVHRAARVLDGSLIRLGSTRFRARVSPADGPPWPGPELSASRPELGHEPSREVARFEPNLPSSPGHELAAYNDPKALMAWVANAVRGGNGEIVRRQAEFQAAVTRALRQMQQDNAVLLTAQLERIESIDREIASLRSELVRREIDAERDRYPAPPNVEPLRIPRPDESDATPSTESKAPTAWLLQRVNQLETENRSAWKDLVNRLSNNRPPAS